MNKHHSWSVSPTNHHSALHTKPVFALCSTKVRHQGGFFSETSSPSVPCLAGEEQRQRGTGTQNSRSKLSEHSGVGGQSGGHDLDHSDGFLFGRLCFWPTLLILGEGSGVEMAGRHLF